MYRKLGYALDQVTDHLCRAALARGFAAECGGDCEVFFASSDRGIGASS